MAFFTKSEFINPAEEALERIIDRSALKRKRVMKEQEEQRII